MGREEIGKKEKEKVKGEKRIKRERRIGGERRKKMEIIAK